MSKSFGKKLVRAMDSSGCDVAQLAEEMNVSVQTIYNWRRGKNEPASPLMEVRLRGYLGDFDGYLWYWLSAAREQLGWSIAELADAAGIAGQTIRNIESGRVVRPNARSMEALIETLAMQEPFLVQDSNEAAPVHPPASPRVFISYRRKDAIDISARLYSVLAGEFGADSIFKDLEKLEGGDPWRQRIIEAIQPCRVFILLVSADWRGRNADGSFRLNEDNDMVRREVEEAFRDDGRLILPIIVGEGTVVTSDGLPESIIRLSEINAMRLRSDADFSRDADLIVTRVRAQLSRESED